MPLASTMPLASMLLLASPMPMPRTAEWSGAAPRVPSPNARPTATLPTAPPRRARRYAAWLLGVLSLSVVFGGTVVAASAAGADAKRAEAPAAPAKTSQSGKAAKARDTSKSAPVVVPAGAGAGIDVEVQVGSDRGIVRCALYDQRGWLKRPVDKSRARPEGKRGICHFDSLPPGTYAVGAYHDENHNAKLDRNLLGLPREPWGVSNGVRGGSLIPPSFREAQFVHTGTPLTLTVSLRR